MFGNTAPCTIGLSLSRHVLPPLFYFLALGYGFNDALGIDGGSACRKEKIIYGWKRAI